MESSKVYPQNPYRENSRLSDPSITRIVSNHGTVRLLRCRHQLCVNDQTVCPDYAIPYVGEAAHAALLFCMDL